MIREVHIQGFKCLRDVSVRGLGPLNVIIGDNDSGKSSFLQALSEMGVELRERGLAAARAGETRFECSGDEGEFKAWGGPVAEQARIRAPGPGWTSVRNSTQSDARFVAWWRGSGLWHRFGTSKPVSFDPESVARAPQAGAGDLAELIRNRGHGTAAHFAKLALGDRARYDAVNAALRNATDGRVVEYQVGENQGNGYPLAFRLADGTVVPAAETSQGLLVFAAFLALIHREDAPSVLLVEEPENHLHPLRLRELVDMLRSLSAQVFMTTHSPDLLSACRPEEVLVFLRPRETDATEIHRLPADFERRAMRETLGQIWASRGEAGLLDLLPAVKASVVAEPR